MDIGSGVVPHPPSCVQTCVRSAAAADQTGTSAHRGCARTGRQVTRRSIGRTRRAATTSSSALRMARMPYTFSPMTQANSSEIAAWRYPGTYAIYDMTPPGAEADLSELLDARSPHFAVSDERSE